MKKLILMMTIGFLALTGESALAGPTITVTTTAELARPKKDCKQGLWICHIKIGVGVGAFIRSVVTEVTDNKDGTMLFVFKSNLPEQGASFFADNDEIVFFDKETTAQFGYNSIQLVPGTYKLNPPTADNFGSVTINIKTK